MNQRTGLQSLQATRPMRGRPARCPQRRAIHSHTTAA